MFNGLFASILLAIVVSGCMPLSPADSLARYMNSMIDRNVDKIKPMEFGYQGNLIESTRLPNGNVANRYFHKDRKGAFCFYSFEVDGRTRRIIDWRIEGNETPCYDR